jgi:hypothetical protein
MDICRWLKVKMAIGKRGRASKGPGGSNADLYIL